MDADGMRATRTRRQVAEVWQHTVHGPDGESHNVVIYRVPSVFPRGPHYHRGGVEEGPPLFRLLMWGDAFWYEATVDGEWADPGGHEAYATYEDALAVALERASCSPEAITIQTI